MTITPNDILAAGDVLDELTEASDQLDMPAAYALRESVDSLIEKAKLARDLLNQQIAKTLEGQPALVKNAEGKDVVLSSAPTGKWRPDQSKIRRCIVAASKYGPSGTTIKKADDRIERAVDIMYSFFVAPSTMPKKGGLKLLGLDVPDVAEYERTGFELKEKVL